MKDMSDKKKLKSLIQDIQSVARDTEKELLEKLNLIYSLCGSYEN